MRWLDRAHEARLQDLAVWMRDRGGPVEEMDASTASLVTLWEWVISEVQAGLPGIPDGARSAKAEFLRYTNEAPNPRARSVGEPIADYIFEVLRRENPSAYWGVDPAAEKSSTRYQQPGILLPGDRFFIHAVDFAPRWTAGVEKGLPRSFWKDILLTEMEYSGWQRPTREERGTSILTPLLDLPRVAPDDPVRRLPLAREVVEPDDGRWSISDVGAKIAADLDREDDPNNWAPLDEQLIAEMLNLHGWHTPEGDPLTPEFVGTDGVQLMWGDDQVMLEVTADEGHPRLLHLDILAVTDEEWAMVEAHLEELAVRLGARLGVAGDDPPPRE